jgi:RNA polymerase II subunit A-like phosphatase
MDEDDGPTPLTLPPSLPYPISVTRIFVAPPDPLQRGSHLFEYRFTSATSRKALSLKSRGLPAEEGDDDAREWDMVGTWDSEVEGETVNWEGWLTVGAVIESRQAGSVPLRRRLSQR